MKVLFRIVYILIQFFIICLITKEFSKYGLYFSKQTCYVFGIFGALISLIVVNRFDDELLIFIRKLIGNNKEED